jgi:hypothetical protein
LLWRFSPERLSRQTLRVTITIAGITTIGSQRESNQSPVYLAGLFLVRAPKHPQRQA